MSYGLLGKPDPRVKRLEWHSDYFHMTTLTDYQLWNVFKHAVNSTTNLYQHR